MDRRDLMLVGPGRPARRIQVIDALGKLVPRMEEARRVYESSIEQHVQSRRSARHEAVMQT